MSAVFSPFSLAFLNFQPSTLQLHPRPQSLSFSFIYLTFPWTSDCHLSSRINVVGRWAISVITLPLFSPKAHSAFPPFLLLFLPCDRQTSILAALHVVSCVFLLRLTSCFRPTSSIAAGLIPFFASSCCRLSLRPAVANPLFAPCFRQSLFPAFYILPFLPSPRSSSPLSIIQVDNVALSRSPVSRLLLCLLHPLCQFDRSPKTFKGRGSLKAGKGKERRSCHRSAKAFRATDSL